MDDAIGLDVAAETGPEDPVDQVDVEEQEPCGEAGHRADLGVDALLDEVQEDERKREQDDEPDRLPRRRRRCSRRPTPRSRSSPRSAPRSRACNMKRQMIPAPMNEIAMGRKINDLAAFSAPARSARTATARPSTVASEVTTMTHHTLLKIVPRTRRGSSTTGRTVRPGSDRSSWDCARRAARPPSGEHADEYAQPTKARAR